MKRFVLLLAALALANGHSVFKRATNCACGWSTQNDQTRIVGGVEARVNEFPYAAALMMKNGGQFCGGTIISEYHILTAAHCTAGKTADQIVVSVGDHDWASDDDTDYAVKINVARIIDHADYQPQKGFWNDMSILVLEEAIEFNVNVGPACLPPKDLNLDGKTVTVAGWGMTSFDYNTNPWLTKLQKIDLNAISFEECKKYWGLNPDNNQICLTHNGSGLYKGDSGGTIVYRDPDTTAFLIVGVPSYVNAANPGGAPSVSSRVSAFLDWIETNVKESKPEAETCSPYY